jgi:hypothetical protein
MYAAANFFCLIVSAFPMIFLILFLFGFDQALPAVSNWPPAGPRLAHENKSEWAELRVSEVRFLRPTNQFRKLK